MPWTGGIPNRTWTGLDPKASTTHRFANQLRHLGSYAGTNELNRRQGLAKKFEKGDCLTTLTHQLTQHLLTHGMDTMAYVPSPVDGSTEMVSIIDHHGLFDTPEALAVTLEPFRKKWDAYDESNNSEATAFLLASISSDIHTVVFTLMTEDEPFPVTYLRVMQHNATHNENHLKSIKTALENIKPTDYPGQDIGQMGAAILTKANSLLKANHFTPETTKKVLENLLLAGGGHEHHQPGSANVL